MKRDETCRLKLANELGELERIKSALDELCDDFNITPKIGLEINLALEEAFTNIVNYAFRDEEKHSIELLIVADFQKLVMTLVDDGIAYDPTQNKEPQLDLPVHDRPVGGLGVFLIKKLMDGVEYRREAGKNHLILTKHLS